MKQLIFYLIPALLATHSFSQTIVMTTIDSTIFVGDSLNLDIDNNGLDDFMLMMDMITPYGASLIKCYYDSIEI